MSNLRDAEITLGAAASTLDRDGNVRGAQALATIALAHAVLAVCDQISDLRTDLADEISGRTGLM